MNDLRPWPLRVLWVLLPFTLGVVIDDALAGRVSSLRVGATVMFWVLWALVLIATLIPRAETLTFARVVVPGAPIAAVWAALASEVNAMAIVSLVITLAAAVVVLLAPIGDWFVNGSSYGDERRMPLRPPLAMVLAPIPLAWIVVVCGALAGPLLLLTHVWIVGAVITAVGWAAAAFGVRALHHLSRRWLVFVPAGFVLHDHLAVSEPVLFPRGDIVVLAAAPAGSQARDLTVGAAGLALQVDFALPVSMTPITPPTDGDVRDVVEMVGITQFLFMPSQPGQVLAEATRRDIRTTRADSPLG